MAEREGIATMVANKAPEECPDRITVASLGIDINLHEYRAHFTESGDVQCLGSLANACTDCQLRVASYTVKTPHGPIRLPIEAVTPNPK